MKLFVCLAAALSIVALTARAQSPPPDPRFDVVSVKRNTSGGPMLQRNTPGNIAMFNVPVRQLVRLAYQLQDFQIAGAPDWVNTDRFDIEARFDPAPPLSGPAPQVPRMPLMMRSLLRDRFGMAAHMETREMPILALRLARADGRLGPQLKPSAVDCAALNASRGRGPAGGPPPAGTPFSDRKSTR